MSSNFKKESLDYHKFPKPGKLMIKPTVEMNDQGALAKAYSPGVAYPCLEIKKDPATAYDYTNKGNMVAVISNGTAVLGLGNIGAIASKPVMEGKSILFKKFANVDSIDLEVESQDVEELVKIISKLGAGFGGINLEDIKAPDCFIVEQKLKEIMNIPVFHDDQHGTAIIVAAGLLNALELTNRKIDEIKIVINGPGAAGIACGNLLKDMGVPKHHIIYCDQAGVVYEGRKERMNPWKCEIAVPTDARTLDDIIEGADVFIGLSVKDALSPEMLKKMNPDPIIFALANPDPEIDPKEVYKIYPNAIVATGRSDYKNQINNVMGFPYIFRGALDVQATEINEGMKIAAVKAIADLAKEPVPEEVMHAYNRHDLIFGPDYLIPMPFDHRLLAHVSAAVAKAAMDSGVAQKTIEDLNVYMKNLSLHHDPTYNIFNNIHSRVEKSGKRIIFSEGEEESIIRAANHLLENKLCSPVLIGDKEKVHKKMKELGIRKIDRFEIMNAAICEHNDEYIEYMYKKLWRDGYLYRDCVRAVKNKRNIFASCMLACGHGDGLVAGVTRTYAKTLRDFQLILPSANGLVFGMVMLFSEERVLFVADTNVIEDPTPEQFVEIAIKSAEKVRQLGREPRVAFVSHSTFGSRTGDVQTQNMRKAIELLNEREVDFEYDGEMSISVALNEKLKNDLYKFSNLSSEANILIMPNLQAANIAYKFLIELSEYRAIGPFLVGMQSPVQIAQIGSSSQHIINAAIWAASEAVGDEK